MKAIYSTYFMTPAQWKAGNGQPIREMLLRQAVAETTAYATDIIYTLDKIPQMLESCVAFTLWIAFCDTHIEEFGDVDRFDRRFDLIQDAKTVWAFYADRDDNKLRIYDITEEALAQIKERRFPSFAVYTPEGGK